MTTKEKMNTAKALDIATETEERSPLVLSVIKAFGLLESIVAATDGLSLKDACQQNRLHPSTAHRLLQTLIEIGYVRQDPRTRRYHVGTRAHTLATPEQRHVDLQSVAMPHLRALAEQTMETVSLYVLEGQEVVHLVQAESPGSVHMLAHIGARMPLHSTASGKVLLAYMPHEQRKHVLEYLSLERHTPNTITQIDELKVELDRIRRRHYAIDDEEQEIGMRCIAAAIYDANGHVVTAINIAGPSGRISVHRLMELSQFVQIAATNVSRALGYSA